MDCPQFSEFTSALPFSKAICSIQYFFFCRRSNAGMVMSNLEVDVLDELDSCSKSSLVPHSLSRKSAPDGYRRVLSSVWVGQCCRMCPGSWTQFLMGTHVRQSEAVHIGDEKSVVASSHVYTMQLLLFATLTFVCWNPQTKGINNVLTDVTRITSCTTET